MKQIFKLFAIAAVLVFAATSCEKDPIGGTSVEALSGQWYVQVDGADSNGNITMEDPFGMGRFMVLTYNTVEDNGTDMYIDDMGNFWEFKIVAKGDNNSLTFSAGNAENLYYDCNVTVTDGKIVPGGAVSPSGQPVDYIEFYLVFSDDDYVGEYYDKMKFSGWRYTGFVVDD